MPSDTLFNIPFETIHGDSAKLADFKGQVLLIVNVASECGSTPQYKGLEDLQKKYHDQGFSVIGFPANNFGEQEPGSNEQILTFCTTMYGVSFPMMSKISVAGDDKHPLYQYLTTHSDPPGDPTWNFNKYLIDKDGNLVAHYTNKTEPDDPALVKKIEELLKQ